MSVGKCACCPKDNVNLVAKGLCGRCYPYANRNEIYFEEESGLWVARIEALAERLGCFWNKDPERFLEIPGGQDAGDGAGQAGEFEAQGEFAEHAKPDEERSFEAGAEPGDMPPGFEGFTPYDKLTSPKDPSITIQKNGKILFTKAACDAVNFKGLTHVKLWWNGEKNQVGFQLLPPGKDAKALKLSNVDKGTDICINGNGFFAANRVSPRLGGYLLREIVPGWLKADIKIEAGPRGAA